MSIDPNKITDYEAHLDDFVSVLHMQIKRMIDDSEILRSCINCHHWNHQQEICTMYGNARPPARIIARGCQGHSKAIPF